MDKQPYAPSWVRWVLPVVVLLVGTGLTVLLSKMRKPPKRQPQQNRGTLVEVLTAQPEDRHVTVLSQGTVSPQQQVGISSQVPGKIIWVHPSLKVGGMIDRGEALIKLDPVDFRLALEQARAAAVQAQKNLVETQSNATVARREWKTLGEQTGQREANPLALFEPQLELAQANMRSAAAQIEQAKVNLARTVIRAPFNLRVRGETVDQGQYVGVGQALATVYGTDGAEVIVPLPVAELRWLRLPRQPKQKKISNSEAATTPTPSAVTVSVTIGGKQHSRPGTLLRTVGEIDTEGRMAKVVVGIDDPYNLQPSADASDFQPEFQIGTFVDVAIEGRLLPHVFPIPAIALRLGSMVWLADSANKLRLRKVQIARLTEDEALISSGLTAGDRVVLTTISSALDGMPLRIKQEGQDPSALRVEASAP